MLDILQNDENYNKIMYVFYKIIKKCKTDKDFEEVRNFFKEISEVGSIGKKIFDGISDLISNKGIEVFSELEKTSDWQISMKKFIREDEELKKVIMQLPWNSTKK